MVTFVPCWDKNYTIQRHRSQMAYHRYAVAFACATNFALTIGSSLCLGVFTEIFMDSFAINNAQVSLVMSIPISVLCTMSTVIFNFC